MPFSCDKYLLTLAVIHPHPPSELQPQLDLNCLVLNDNTHHIFPIEIAERKTVGALKDAIKDKKEHTFQHVDADRLILWKVCIPINRNLTTNLSKLDFVHEGSLLPAEELSEVFSDSPVRKSLHIVVRAPPAGELDRNFPIAHHRASKCQSCWMPTADSTSPFS
jgi:hypothetical protein